MVEPGSPISVFKVRVNNIIEWSSIDVTTKNVLKELMKEVADLAEKMSET